MQYDVFLFLLLKQFLFSPTHIHLDIFSKPHVFGKPHVCCLKSKSYVPGAIAVENMQYDEFILVIINQIDRLQL